MTSEERDEKLIAAILKNKPQSTVSAAFEKLAAELANAETAAHVRLSEAVYQIAKGEKAFHLPALRQFTNRRITPGSMARSLLKHVPKLFGRGRRELFGSLQSPIALPGGFFQDGHLLGSSAVFPLGVVRGLDIDLAQRHDIGAADDANILASRRGRSAIDACSQ